MFHDVPNCKSDLEIVGPVLEPTQIARYLKHSGMPAATPARAGVKTRIIWNACCSTWKRYPAEIDQ
jgi:hypothetical protein